MKWFKKKTDYKRLWTLGEIDIEDVPDDYLYAKGRSGGFDFRKACTKHMKARREAREVQ